MKISFKTKEVEKLCTDIKVMQRKLPSNVTRKLQILMTTLENMKHMTEFQLPVYARYRYHQLSGDMQGITSLSIDYSYRITLVVEIVGTQDNCDEICIWEVSNHYGD